METVEQRLQRRLDTGRATATDTEKTGTYTFTNKEGATVSLALSIVALLLVDQVDIAFLLTEDLRTRKDQVLPILKRISDQIKETQCPKYIRNAFEQTLDEIA